MITNEAIVRKILVAMHLPVDVPELHPERLPPARDDQDWDAEDYVN